MSRPIRTFTPAEYPATRIHLWHWISGLLRIPPVVAFVGALLLLGCAGAAERAAWKDASRRDGSFEQARPRGTSPESKASESAARRTKGEASSLDRYVALAMQRNPELRASFDRWRASVQRISMAGKLPDPQVSFGYFIQSVETRVGPQRARISLQQSFPWPTKLTASAGAAAAGARAQQVRVEALALAIRQRVEVAYFELWLVRQTRRIHAEHLLVVRSLSESVLARVATGAATLADQQQVDLAAARLEDTVLGMDEAEAAKVAQLHAALGTSTPRLPATETGPPPAALPNEEFESLAASARAHPFLRSFEELAVAKEEQARADTAGRYPNFSIGADYIVVGEAEMPNVADSGKDAISVGAGMTIPLWQGTYSDAAEASRAEADGQRAERDAAENRAIAELETALATVRDAARRVSLYKGTLLPQAESAYDSVLGSYATGRGTVAQTLLAQRDLLDLRLEVEQARAAHAMAWARLESVVGRHVAARVTEGDSMGKANGSRRK